MMWTTLQLSRVQSAFTVSSRIFPSFTIGVAAWLTLLEAFHLISGKPVYRRLFDVWLKIFGITFGLGVFFGIVLAFEFGMNWSRLSEVTGPIQGPLLTYESFTFALEASFLGVLAGEVLIATPDEASSARPRGERIPGRSASVPRSWLSSY
jgi:cytochrome bd ubiquinol oxidase subunit I